jgi:hypothetical protein
MSLWGSGSKWLFRRLRSDPLRSSGDELFERSESEETRVTSGAFMSICSALKGFLSMRSALSFSSPSGATSKSKIGGLQALVETDEYELVVEVDPYELLRCMLPLLCLRAIGARACGSSKPELNNFRDLRPLSLRSEGRC